MKVCFACGAKFAGADWRCPSCHVMPKLIDGYTAFSPEAAITSRSFKVCRFAQLDDVEADNFWLCSRNRLIIWALERYFRGARNFFEIGCGIGFALSGIKKALPYLSLCGGDIHVAGLKYARKRLKNSRLFQMDARRIPFENEFDVIGAFDLLEHVKEDGLVLSQMHKALREKGGIILSVPQHRFLWSRVDEYECHARRYTAGELKGKVEQAGFETIKMTSFISLLLPLVVFSRLIMQRFNKDHDVMAELKPNGAANVILKKILDLERGLIRLGIPLPFGANLLLVARKSR